MLMEFRYRTPNAVSVCAIEEKVFLIAENSSEFDRLDAFDDDSFLTYVGSVDHGGNCCDVWTP